MRYRYAGTGIVLLATIVLTLDADAGDEATDVAACNAGNAVKCEELAERYKDGTGGVKQDLGKSITYLEKACNFRSGRACNSLGVAWLEGKNPASVIDFTKAGAYYKKACEFSNGLGCFNLAMAYGSGEGVLLDRKLAAENFKKACDLEEAKGCTELATMYYRGKTLTKDVEMAKTLLEKGCKLGDAKACRNLELLKNPK